ncbi:MAG: hypothetical protein CMH56_11980 [Myxococcales bacterium]|nr:hypothetical protein [Myxococcales bacterium]|tara:strand:+ start:2976 stop:3521 length:546 start_codon:yes stop_codon:yes gene_type:complete
MKSQALKKQGQSPIQFCAPGVGYFSPQIASGALVEGGQVVAILECLGQKKQLRVPDGGIGRVTWNNAQTTRQAVGYGDVLGTFSPWAGAETEGSASETASAQKVAFQAPMEGLFYTRPDPESPAFVTQGQTLNKGDQVGLIEVMKTFYPIYYENDAPKQVTAIIVENAQPVEIGTPLFDLA